METTTHFDDVFCLLEKAKLLEKDGQRIEASTKYYEGCHLMRQIVSRFPLGDTAPEVVLLREKIKIYTLQAQRLYFDESSSCVGNPTSKTTTIAPATITLPRATTIITAEIPDDVSVLTLPGNQSSNRSEIHRWVGLANARLERAIDLELNINNTNTNTNTNNELVIRSYLSAAEAYLSAMRVSEEASLRLPLVVTRRLEDCLNRTEALKHPARNRCTV